MYEGHGLGEPMTLGKDASCSTNWLTMDVHGGSRIEFSPAVVSSINRIVKILDFRGATLKRIVRRRSLPVLRRQTKKIIIMIDVDLGSQWQ